MAVARREEPGRDAVGLLLCRVVPAHLVAELGAGHAVLKLGLPQHRRDHAVLVEQDVLVEAGVGDADDLGLAVLLVAAADRDLADWARLERVERVVAVVVAGRVRGREVRDPPRVEYRVQPRAVLVRDGDGARHRDDEWHPHADRLVEDLEDPPHVAGSEDRQAVEEEVLRVLGVGHGLDRDRGAHEVTV